MKTKNPNIKYETYTERMKKMGSIKVKEITIDPQKYAEYIARMEHNLALLDEIQKQNAKTAMLRSRIVGRRSSKIATGWVRYKTEKDA